jgi:hypothetical protein
VNEKFTSTSSLNIQIHNGVNTKFFEIQFLISKISMREFFSSPLRPERL